MAQKRRTRREAVLAAQAAAQAGEVFDEIYDEIAEAESMRRANEAQIRAERATSAAGSSPLEMIEEATAVLVEDFVAADIAVADAARATAVLGELERLEP